MKRIDNKKNLYKSIILLIILVIGIGYAYLTSNLSITGATEVVANTWNIHFENLNITTGSVTATTDAEIDSNETSIEYAITLSRPKDFYEFTVDIKNDGTLPGKVSVSTLSGLDATSSKVIDYSIKYTYGQPVDIGDILNGGATKTIKVRVYYKDDIDEDDLPENNLNLNLTYTLQYVQSEEDAPSVDDIIQSLKTNNSSCFTKYEGNVTDRVGVTEEATNVYFDKCEDKRNLIFNNMCWQMIRTTETGGLRLMYNGESVDGKCESTRGDHKGIVGKSGSSQKINSNYKYGSSFTYDISTNEFTLIDTTTATWGDSTYENLIGQYTCMNLTGICTTIYNVNGYLSNTTAYTSSYTIKNTNYDRIGTSSFNANYSSPAMVGYMFNKVYKYFQTSLSSDSLKGNNVSYSNGIYTLLPADGESELETTKDDTHHYTCNNTTGTCSKVRYYYYENYYIELDGEANINEVINKMLYNDDVNRYNSSMKGVIDSWYVQNLSSKTNMLEDTVFCNARNMTNQSTNGWNKDGSLSVGMYFKNNELNNDISCTNITDQFAVGNNKSKLIYPVGLIQREEVNNINNNSLMSTGLTWWTFSPGEFLGFVATGRVIEQNGNNNNDYVIYTALGVRPVISLKNGIVISGGTGSQTNPWVVD